jgi:hypothetical protein
MPLTAVLPSGVWSRAAENIYVIPPLAPPPLLSSAFQVLCYEDNRLMKLFKDIVKLLYNAGETHSSSRRINSFQRGGLYLRLMGAAAAAAVQPMHCTLVLG